MKTRLKIAMALVLVSSVTSFHMFQLPPSKSSFELFSTTTKTTSASLPLVYFNVDDVTSVSVIGAGPAGLAATLQLLKQGKKVTVYDRLSEPLDPADSSIWSASAGGVERFYLIGLGGRGQQALDEIDVWEDYVKPYCSEVVGRKDWSPGSEEGVERVFTDRPYTTMVLPRDKLTGALYTAINKKYSQDDVKFNFGVEVDIESFGAGEGEPSKSGEKNNDVVLKVARCDATTEMGECEVGGGEEELLVRSNFVVAADGSGRSVAQRLAEVTDTKVVSYTDDNVRIYKTIPLKLPKSWRYDLNYSARTGDGRFNLDALPATPEGDYCAVMLLKETDPLAKENADPAQMRIDFDKILPQFSSLIDDTVMERVAKKPVSRLPSFRYVSPKLHHGKVLLLGDCVHTVKPYFGLGANSALEDVATLGSIMENDENGYEEVAKEFTKRRGREAKALVKLSRGFDRPGKLGFATFILPLILDGIFHGLLPSVFAPNTIAMLQASKANKDGKAIQYCFNEVIWRKRMDRIGQLSIIGSVLTGCAIGLKAAVGVAARLTGKRRVDTIVGGGVLGVALNLLMRVYKNLQDNSAGELLVKTGQDINGKGGAKGGLKALDNESFLMDARSKQRERDGG